RGIGEPADRAEGVGFRSPGDLTPRDPRLRTGSEVPALRLRCGPIPMPRTDGTVRGTSPSMLDQAIGDGDRGDRTDDDAREDHPDEARDPVGDPLLRPVLGVRV